MLPGMVTGVQPCWRYESTIWLDSLEDLSAPKNMVEDFWDVHFSSVTVQGMVVDSNMNGFSNLYGKLLAILVYYLEVGNAGLGWLFEMLCLYIFTGDMISVSFYSIFQTSTGFFYVKMVTMFFLAGQFVDYVSF